MANVRGVLVKVKGDGGAFASAAAKSFGAGGLEIEPILHIPAKANGRKGFAADGGRTWLRVQQRGGTGTAWDLAHDLLAPNQPFAAAAQSGIEAIEPDFEQEWPFREKPEPGKGFAASSMAELCAFDPQSADGGKAVGPAIAWNLNPSFSELAKARARVGAKLEKVFVAHLDTGYDPTHITLPKNLRRDLQRNFVADDNRPDDASDQTPQGMTFLQNRGHGTGTLSLLAGNKLDGTSPQWNGFTDFVGGAPLAQIIPVRIANWVVRFSTSTMVKGFDYAREKGAHVLSMSMGGLSSEALVDAINLAYDAGLVMVTAGGNNFADVLSSIVFPARYRRVLAACGVMADGRAYSGLKTGTMQGNYGPASKMDTAIGAYTPNVPWAQIDCGKIVDMDGAGTSAATPQVAAAVALWLAEYFDDVMNYPQPWMRVEAVRHALFKAAEKTTAKMNAAETREKIGQGVLKALAALDVRPPAASALTKLPPAEASWSWLDMLFGVNVSLAPGEKRSAQREAMLKLELTQLAARDEKVAEAIADPEAPRGKISEAARKRYLEAALDSGKASAPLRAYLLKKLGRKQAATPAASPRRARRIFKEPEEIPPAFRRLRTYALDPSVAKSLSSVSVNETTLKVPWEKDLKPGPIGEYLEIIDIDPASNRAYDPVDLNRPNLLAQDGHAPSEGNPQFHQQMVYAVAMTTIKHFEDALGRKALWSPRDYDTQRRNGKQSELDRNVQRLRIYPHALRTTNAYYSPDKKALLFGYFPADSRDGDTTPPGSLVFSCLSSDIIAHEMSHALLDGMHRRFQEASNPDVPAFHEAFADIVALFQHFTVPELVRFEIDRARGKLSAANLLSGLAKQFGEGSSRRGPLRNYTDPAMKELRYDDSTEVHTRGSILVFAVYEAFLNIVARRTVDLLRLATGGTGILRPGALHPDLVNRLTAETMKTARHVLRMCIRALDYCPSVDITFGEYLRALITADLDVVKDDVHSYRVAFMEAFRNRGILPRDVKTISVESLRWSTLVDPKPDWLRGVIASLNIDWNREPPRSELCDLHEENGRRLHDALERVFEADPELYGDFGLVPDLPRYRGDRSVRQAAAPGKSTFNVLSVRRSRRIGPDGDLDNTLVAVIQQRRPELIDPDEPAGPTFWFRGGATLIIDARPGKEKIRYSIIKNINSKTRLQRQRDTVTGGRLSALQSLYFGDDTAEPFAMMHAATGEG